MLQFYPLFSWLFTFVFNDFARVSHTLPRSMLPVIFSYGFSTRISLINKLSFLEHSRPRLRQPQNTQFDVPNISLERERTQGKTRTVAVLVLVPVLNVTLTIVLARLEVIKLTDKCLIRHCLVTKII